MGAALPAGSTCTLHATSWSGLSCTPTGDRKWSTAFSIF